MSPHANTEPAERRRLLLAVLAAIVIEQQDKDE